MSESKLITELRNRIELLGREAAANAKQISQLKGPSHVSGDVQ